jgi:ribonuclease R
MPDRYSRRILQHLADSRYRPQGIRDLAKSLGVDPDSFNLFETSVQQLIQQGQVVLGPSDTVIVPPPGREMTGTFRLSGRGFGFIVPDSPTEHGDLFVPPPNTGGAMTGDRVRAKVIHESRRAGGDRSPYIGLVEEIIQRADRHYVGNLVQRHGRWFVEVDGKIMPQPVLVRDPDAKNAKEGDKVVLELIDYGSEDAPPEGVILEVLGERGEPEVETRAVMRSFGLPERFEPAVLDQARQAAQSLDDKSIPPGREDFTGTFICTIDPPDAKDYDDAISIRKLEGQGDAAWELGVHIADVSTFVTVGSPLDEEAKKRGNSTYLPRRVVPMLPEVLSNGVCSLQEGVNRFVKSAVMRYDSEGNVLSARFANGVIRSAKRLTYREAQALIDDDIKEARKHAKGEVKYSSELIRTLKLMDELARVIRARRFKAGMITLDLPEVELVYDESGRVIDAEPEDNAFTHKIIEMFMVEANEAAARLFDSLDVPMIRRIHPDPPAHDITELRQFARVAGFNIPAHPSRQELQQLLDSVRGKPQQQAVHLAVLQTLSKAEYSPLLIGHFALASEHYTHFTSPIRRYADLIVHRALDAYLELSGDGRGTGGKRKGKLSKELRDDPRIPDEKALTEIGKHCSATERNSEAAEKSLRTHLVLELLNTHLGDDFEGTVTGVTGSGVFVQIDRYLVDGFIHITDLPGRKAGDLWRLNRLTGALVAQRSGKTITIGDRFVVRIASVDSGSRKLDLAMVEQIGASRRAHEHQAPKTQHRKQPRGAAKAHREGMMFKKLRKKKRRY